MGRGIVWSSLLLALLVGAFLCSPSVATTNWPMWLENPTHTPSPALEPDGVLQTAWKARCGGIFGSAVAYEGGVYLASRDGTLYAVDDETGRPLWDVLLVPRGAARREAEIPPRERWRWYETGFLATPAVDEQRIYVGGLDGIFRARYRETGDPAWSQDLMAAIASSPVLTPQFVVVGTRGGDLFAMDRATGEPQWLYEAGGPINSSPAFGDGKVVVGSAAGVAAVDAGTGEPVWEVPRPDKFDSSSCIAEGRVYIGDWAGKVLALDLSDGAVVWEQQISDRPIFASPALAHDLVYVVTTGSLLVALDTDTGATVWETGLLRGGGYASPIVCGTALLMGSAGYALDVIDATNGDLLVSVPGADFQYLHGTPTVTDNAIYLSSENWPPSPGSITKLTFRPYGPRAEQLRAREAAALTCLALGFLEDEGGEGGGWANVGLPRDVEEAAMGQLQELGVVTQPWNWQRTMTRYQLAALFHKLFWDPNPFNVRLPDFTEAALADFQTFPLWCHETPPKLVGLGLMQPINGSFCGRDAVTRPQLEASLERAKELLAGR
jgi:outer membrane protein assembly factor BamB